MQRAAVSYQSFLRAIALDGLRRLRGLQQSLLGRLCCIGVSDKSRGRRLAAVGVCGYEPPEEHRLCLIHAQPDDHECAVVIKFLAAMVNLADQFKESRETGKKKLVWQPSEKEAHRDAKACRECRRIFDSKKKGCEKVAHHCHTSGSFRGSLCQDCNKAAHAPTKLTICYHNGGHYDFHFLLRGFAKLKHAALTAASARPEKEKPSSSLAGRRKLSTFGVKELSRRVQKVKLQTLVEALPKAVVDTLRDARWTCPSE